MPITLYEDVFDKHGDHGEVIGFDEKKNITLFTEKDAKDTDMWTQYNKCDFPCLIFEVADIETSEKCGQLLLQEYHRIKLSKEDAKIIENFIDFEPFNP